MSWEGAKSFTATPAPLERKDSIDPFGNVPSTTPFARVAYARDVSPVTFSPYLKEAELVGFIKATVFPLVPVTTAVASLVLPVRVSPIVNWRLALLWVSRSDSNCRRSLSS